MKTKLWECSVIIPTGHELAFRVAAHDEKSAIELIENCTHGKCTNIEQEPNLDELKLKPKDILIVVTALLLTIIILFNYWRYILPFCGVCLISFLLLVAHET
jgi:hypothetical protein